MSRDLTELNVSFGRQMIRTDGPQRHRGRIIAGAADKMLWQGSIGYEAGCGAVWRDAAADFGERIGGKR